MAVADGVDPQTEQRPDRPAPAVPPSRSSRAQRALLVSGIVLLGFNLRPGAVTLGPVLEEVTGALGMSHAVAGVATALPVLAFASFGALAPALARRVGVHRVALLALVAMVAGQAGRAVTGSAAVFLLLTLVALAGMATGNVLLPSLVKLHFPDRQGLLTGLYTTAMALGATVSTVLTVPIADATGTWRWGLAAWAALAAVAAVPWVALVRHDAALPATRRAITLGQVARTRLGWALALMFGLQSAQAYAVLGWFPQLYRDAGFSPATAALIVGVLAALGIPLSLVMPTLAARRADQTWLMVGLIACYPVGYVGLLVAPVAGAWLWAAAVGVGMCLFPVLLTLFGLRARTDAGTAALSGFVQSAGYLLAAIGPLGVAALYDATGGWTAPLVALTGAALLLLPLVPLVARPGFVEDQLPRLDAARR